MSTQSITTNANKAYSFASQILNKCNVDKIDDNTFETICNVPMPTLTPEILRIEEKLNVNHSISSSNETTSKISLLQNSTQKIQSPKEENPLKPRLTTNMSEESDNFQPDNLTKISKKILNNSPKLVSPLPKLTTYNPTSDYKIFFKELPKISAKDYMGKETCTICYKEVKDSQQSISCNSCPRWTHRKCCRIKIKKFKRLAKLKSFDWYCINCREDDTIQDDLYSPPINFEIHDLPDKYEIVMKTKNELLIIHLNCRSLVRKEEELQNILELLDPDIICLSETWFDLSVPINSHIPEGYNIIRKDRTENFQQKYKKKNGGGVAILYKSKLNVNIKNPLNDDTEDILWAEVKMKKSFLLGVPYRPDHSVRWPGKKYLNFEKKNT